MRPLRGIKVLEWGVIMQVPVAASMLGQLGAEVTKLEEPIRGDPIRGMRRTLGVTMELPGGRNLLAEHHNTNKRSIAIDLRKHQGKEVLYRLIKESDVFLHNHLASRALELGLDYDTLSKRNARLIYVASSAYGTKGPDAEVPAFDFAAQGRSGIMTQVGELGMPPLAMVPAPADMITSWMVVSAVLMGLIARDRLGVGQKVDVSMLAGMIYAQRLNVFATLLGRPLPMPPRTSAPNPLYNHYRCADDKWILLAVLQEKDWPGFCSAMGVNELEKNPKYSNADKREQNCNELISILDKLFASKTRDEWLRILREGANFPYAPVNTIADLVNDAQVLENDYIVECNHPTLGKMKYPSFPIQLNETPAEIMPGCPELGQHTEEVLLELGYTWAQITELKDQGVI